MLQAHRRALALVAGLCLIAPSVLRSEEKYKLEEPADDIRIYGVGTRINITGKLQTAPKANHLSQTVSAALSYRERRLLGPGNEAETFRSVREYQVAEAEIAVDGKQTTSRLPDALKLIIAQGRTEGVELYGLNGLLSPDELDLIRSPADSLALISLLPSKEIEIGDKWTVPNWAFQMLTGIDAVVKQNLECKLESVEKDIARIEVDGTLEGAVVGSTTEVKLSGFFTYNVKEKYIQSADFVQKETRAVGPVSPGLDITARIRVLRNPGTSVGKLADQKIIDAAAKECAPAGKHLRIESQWNIGLEHGRHWHVYKIDDNVAVFRLLQEGNFVAQCDMASIPPAKAGGHLSEQAYLTDIRQSLGDRLRNLSSGEVIPSSDRKFVYKVIASGEVGERQVTWVFYLVADPSGRQASFMFTVDTSLSDKLASFDREIVDSLKFGPAPVRSATVK